ncbi:hypothetical protein JRC04_07650 [Mycolicibacterium sp. S2-37]|uniref:hypothetical protein n=1 Tax=Mycolicibacterium sp. S2-37 TaxID=2810297 RepID=UPI001A94A459|nr:hypothetical protein [Mycolicibacterium sp. S2-37]MBO0677333.1 hypothetical protein [Mycolicibacterium sp. S2-37]
MKELFVDTTRLGVAAGILGDLVLPSAPPPINVPGADAVSAAINAAMPVVESPVIQGLSGVRESLAATAENMASAATLYDDTDRMHGEALEEWNRQAVWSRSTSADGPAPGSAERTDVGGGLEDPAAAGGTEGVPVARRVPDWATVGGAVSGMVTGGQTVMTGVQSAYSSIQGAVSGMQGGAGDEEQDADTADVATEDGAGAQVVEGSRAPLSPAGATTSAPYRGEAGS